MTSKEEVQALLRLISQDARVPLPIALGKIKELQKAELTSAVSLASTSISKIQAIFPDPKQARSILQAAKRASSSKKRPSTSTDSPASKRSKASSLDAIHDQSPSAMEASLALPSPSPDITEEVLICTVLQTNRAPLHLAFAVQALKYTRPEQPLSSRLSLAQAVVSANAKSKAKSIGIQPKKGHEGGHEEQIGSGQSMVRIMGRDVPVLKRWGYNPNEGEAKDKQNGVKSEEREEGVEIDEATQSTLKGDSLVETEPDNPAFSSNNRTSEEPPLWGLDLSSSSSTSSTSPPHAAKTRGTLSPLPIHHPTSSRSYLLKSFHRIPQSASSPKKISAKAIALQKEENLALLLHALDLLFVSWAGVLSAEELDRRAWGWYVAMRPEVKMGEAGWGQKGEVSLKDLLDLRRKGV